ncbi:hypothetical protein [Bacillus sp. LL01]|nr:hypothetical protein [Bacillus sp. LL01]
MKTVYETTAYQIHRLEHKSGYELIAEIFEEEGRRVAALFVVEEEMS